MSSSIFTETIIRAINNYRQLLRKTLSQHERMSKLSELNLRDPELYRNPNPVSLYNLAYKIVDDIKHNFKNSRSYYAYDGPQEFARILENFLANYEIDNNTVTHRAQRASKALIRAIQLMTSYEPDEELQTKLAECNRVIAEFGSDDQKELHKSTLMNILSERENQQYCSFYEVILKNFEGLTTSSQ